MTDPFAASPVPGFRRARWTRVGADEFDLDRMGRAFDELDDVGKRREAAAVDSLSDTDLAVYLGSGLGVTIRESPVTATPEGTSAAPQPEDPSTDPPEVDAKGQDQGDPPAPETVTPARRPRPRKSRR